MDIAPEDKKYLEGQYAAPAIGDMFAQDFRSGKRTRITELKLLDLQERIEKQNEIYKRTDRHLQEKAADTMWWDGTL